MKNVTLLVLLACATLILSSAASSLSSHRNEVLSTSSEEVGVDKIRNGEHECAPGICCPQFLTCLWGFTQFYCCFKPNMGKWTRKMPAYPC